MAALGSGFISCTAQDKTLGVGPPPPDTLNAESPWVAASGASLGKLFLVILLFVIILLSFIESFSFKLRMLHDTRMVHI